VPFLQNQSTQSDFAKFFTHFVQISTDFARIFTKSKLLEVRLQPHLVHKHFNEGSAADAV